MSRHAYDSPGIGATNFHVGQRGRDNRHVLTRLSLWRTALRGGRRCLFKSHQPRGAVGEGRGVSA